MNLTLGGVNKIMTSAAEVQETSFIQPADELISVHHVDSSTTPTGEESQQLPETIDTKPEKNSSNQTLPDRSEQKAMESSSLDDTPPSIGVTEPNPALSPEPPQGTGDIVSVSSMPAAMPSRAAQNVSSPLTPQEADATTVASAPAVVMDVSGDISNLELEDLMSSPHGKNAIVERSPGGRYLRFMEKLGSGASKDVYRAYDTQEGIEVAWNVVHLAGVPKNDRNRIVNEVRLLERLHHQNIISFHGSWVNREKQQVNFVTEILSSGTLQSFINKVQVIRWKIAKRWALQILKGLEYLHSQDPPVIHRDLKCQNIFINGTSGDLRIGDLGLSTVHRNGKALSVLGTPEFMAPDMYEETAYDEKVDIYAFGMCLLEIFTKEIPYRECNNPAQIYKKVIRGDPPDCLRRLKSRHAREFIYLCLGTKDETGKYVRPSATELIDHPFLQQRPSDDDEVEVDPPIQEKTIQEISESSSAGGIKAALSQASKSSETANATVNSSPMNKQQYHSTNSLEGDESDRFEEMPDNETGFRKPKVLMGRGQELQRDPHEQGNEGQAATSNEEAQALPQVLPVPSDPLNAPLLQSSQQTVPETFHAPAPSPSPSPAFHFLVAAAVIEDEFSTSRPYDDDVLKLVVTLPVEGQTQNVQFDFHLVEDDPIQVAKEMVAELGIPPAAVLEISETISGLARAARVKQDKYIARINSKPIHHRSRSASQSAVPPSHGSETILPQHKTIGHGPNTMQAPSHPPIPDYLSTPTLPGQQMGQSMLPQQTMLPQDNSPHLHGQQMGPQAIMPATQMQSQHHPAGESSVNAQGQSHSLGQLSNQIDHAPSNMGQSQQQSNWNHHVQPLPVQATDASLTTGQQNYGHPTQVASRTPLVRSLSVSTQSDPSAPAPAYSNAPQLQNSQPAGNLNSQSVDAQNIYSQVPVQHVQVPNQVQPQTGGQQGMMQRGNGDVYNLQPTQQLPPQTSSQQGAMHRSQGSNQSLPPNAEGAMTFSQYPLHQGQVSNQHASQSGGQQNMLQHIQTSNQASSQQQNNEGQSVYNHIPIHQVQVPSHQLIQNAGQQGVMQIPQVSSQHPPQNADGQFVYTHTPVHQLQVSNSQHALGGDQQSTLHRAPGNHLLPTSGDIQNVYTQASTQQVHVPTSQQVQNGAQQSLIHHSQVANQQQHHLGQQGFDGQVNYGQVPMQQVQVLAQGGRQQGFMQQPQMTSQTLPGDGQGGYVQVPLHTGQVPSQHDGQAGGQNVIDGHGMYGQASMHHAQLPNNQNQSVPQQGQAMSSFLHPSAGQVVQMQQQVLQDGSQVPMISPYVQQQTQHSSAPTQAQVNGAQALFTQGSHLGLQQHAVPQAPLQEMHAMSNNAQNPGYGQSIPQALQQQRIQQPQTIAPVIQTHSQTQTQSIAPSDQQGSMTPQQHTVSNSHAGQPLTQTPAGISQQHVAPVEQPLIDLNNEIPPSISTPQPIPTRVVSEAATPDESRATLINQSSTVSDLLDSNDDHLNGVHERPSINIDDDMLDDELFAAELRKLDEDFQRNMMRAQKVFDTRMDTLQRTQVQREALHQKTLEKHQKERADFEKRRQQEEIEQNRRIEQLQKDWAMRREAMRQKQLAEAQTSEAPSATSPT